jgi:hypothetical protein
MNINNKQYLKKDDKKNKFSLTPSIILISTLLLVFLYEFGIGYTRQQDRIKLFIKATTKSKELHRELIVIGDPKAGVGSNIYGTTAYGYGDYTIDINECIDPPPTANCIKGDMISILKRFDDNSKVIYISCVLEYVPNIGEAIGELYRVAGTYENIFNVRVNPYTLSAYFYGTCVPSNTSKNIILDSPPNKPYRYKQI